MGPGCCRRVQNPQNLVKPWNPRNLANIVFNPFLGSSKPRKYRGNLRLKGCFLAWKNSCGHEAAGSSLGTREGSSQRQSATRQQLRARLLRKGHTEGQERVIFAGTRQCLVKSRNLLLFTPSQCRMVHSRLKTLAAKPAAHGTGNVLAFQSVQLCGSICFRACRVYGARMTARGLIATEALRYTLWVWESGAQDFRGAWLRDS